MGAALIAGMARSYNTSKRLDNIPEQRFIQILENKLQP
jgi:hypothetical protein